MAADIAAARQAQIAAVDRARRILANGPSADSPEQFAVGALRPGSRSNYAQALGALLAFLRTDPVRPGSLDDAVARMLVAHAAAGRKRSTVGGLLSGIRWGARSLGVPVDPRLALHDCIVKALPRLRSQLAWLHPSSLRHIVSLPRHGLRDDVLTALVVLSYFHALRVSEALRVSRAHFNWHRPDGPSGPTTGCSFTIYRSKDSSGEPRLERVDLHSEAAPWARLLCERCRDDGPVTSLPDTHLNSWLRSRLVRTRGADCTWHSMRRGCATWMWHRGFPLEAIMRQGGWQTRDVCRQYIYPWLD